MPKWMASFMTNDIFIDTSGFYAFLIKGDSTHEEAESILFGAKKQKRRFVTTDYILDETATLLKARGFGHLLPNFLTTLEQSQACRIEWTDSDRFFSTQAFFLKHADQDWSFTDCLSFQVMKQLKLSDALTKDAHFKSAGFRPMLK